MAFLIILLPFVNLFQIVIATQILNAMALPPIFYYLIKFTNSKKLMGDYVNNTFQRWFAIIGTVVIACASLFAIAAQIFHF